MRAVLPGAGETVGWTSSGAVSLGSLLPAVFQEYDPMAVAFTQALDAVLAPVWLTLDCLDALFDPDIAPDDVLEWLATWLAVDVDGLTLEQQRRIVAHGSELHRWRGTTKGVGDLVEVLTGERPGTEGGVITSSEFGGPPPPVAARSAPPPSSSDLAIDRIVRSQLPVAW